MARAGARDLNGPAALFIVFGGLPGTGKTTIARALAARLGAVYLRIDTIEQAIRSSGPGETGPRETGPWETSRADAAVGPAGYAVACGIAADNLRLGRTVIADSVNPLAVTRDHYRAIAQCQGAGCLEIEIVCSDKAEHRRRIETRIPDIPGLRLPTWQDAATRPYEPWDRQCLRIDTAVLTPDAAVEAVIGALT